MTSLNAQGCGATKVLAGQTCASIILKGSCAGNEIRMNSDSASHIFLLLLESRGKSTYFFGYKCPASF